MLGSRDAGGATSASAERHRGAGEHEHTVFSVEVLSDQLWFIYSSPESDANILRQLLIRDARYCLFADIRYTDIVKNGFRYKPIPIYTKTHHACHKI